MKKKILFIIAAIMIISTLIRTLIITYTFLNFSNTTITNEAILIKDILTEVKDKNRFLEIIRNSQHILDVKFIPEKTKTESISFKENNKAFEVKMPFNDYETLIILFNTKDYYKKLSNAIYQLIAIAVISLIVIILTVNYFLTPYLEILENVRRSTASILKGNFNDTLDTKLKGEAKDFVDSYNTFLKKLKDSFGVIEEKYTSLIEKEKSDDPLNDAKETIEQLANIFKFKRLIEDDSSCNDVFQRLIDILNGFNLKHYALIGIDNNEKKSTLIYKNGDICCNVENEFLECRAYRLRKMINSMQYPKICKLHTCDNDYICIPYSAGGNFTGILKINMTKNDEEHINKNLPYIKAYLNELSAIIEAKYTLELLHNQTIKDPLTNTYNRRYLENILPMLINNAKRRNGKIAFLMLDIDYFKKVNDTYGHKAGDTVLKTISDIIKKSIRKSDILIRYGGEEFLIILQNVNDYDDIYKVAEKIRSSVEKTNIHIDENIIHKTISIGVSIFPDNCSEGNECIKESDIALYKAKEEGRNKIIFYKSNL
ncbi:GGDEF domain-containing protein [Nautilia sp. PV-1]|uniref:GGDEF domain-containing protein n=1 Tax=Nautilia sp. PV-1 TaxID=2579250 RepID=UPI000FD9DC14|nr:GGDEF domain-containing protein [Nautilia sp. PV-1]AZV46973.1 GGDEF domain-containing protein [Nautilia sp. PV-1]